MSDGETKQPTTPTTGVPEPTPAGLPSPSAFMSMHPIKARRLPGNRGGKKKMKVTPLVHAAEGPRDIVLHAKQVEIMNCGARFIFVQAGRRFGKTTLSEKWLIEHAKAKANSVWWYVAPTFKAAKELMWQPLLRDIPAEDIQKIDKTNCDVTLKNGAMICIRGSDREDNLRGRRDGIDGAVIEEFSFHKAGVWDLIIRPQLADKKGVALFIGTPSMKKGRQYRQLSEYASAGKDKEWAFFKYTIYDNPRLCLNPADIPSEIAKIKAATPDNAWKQEYLADFVEEEGPVYFEFRENLSVVDATERFPGCLNLPCVVGIDWGMEDKTGVAWVHVTPEGKLVVTDTHAQDNWTAERHSRVILEKNKLRTAVRAHVLDETAFGRRGGTTDTVAKEFHRAGVGVIPSHHVGKDTSISVLKKFFAGDGENAWIYIDKRCKDLIKFLADWQHGQHEPDVASALRFAVYHIFKSRMSQLVSPENIGVSDVKTEELEKKQPVVYRLRQNKEVTTVWGGSMRWDSDGGCWE